MGHADYLPPSSAKAISLLLTVFLSVFILYTKLIEIMSLNSTT